MRDARWILGGAVLFSIGMAGCSQSFESCRVERECIAYCGAPSAVLACSCPEGTFDASICSPGADAAPPSDYWDSAFPSGDAGMNRWDGSQPWSDAAIPSGDAGSGVGSGGGDATCRAMCDAQAAAGCGRGGDCQRACDLRLEQAREIGCEAEWKGAVVCLTRTPCMDDGSCGTEAGWPQCLGL